MTYLCKKKKKKNHSTIVRRIAGQGLGLGDEFRSYDNNQKVGKKTMMASIRVAGDG